MIRLVIVAITVIGFLILSIPILFVEWIIGKFAANARESGKSMPFQTCTAAKLELLP